MDGPIVDWRTSQIFGGMQRWVCGLITLIGFMLVEDLRAVLEELEAIAVDLTPAAELTAS